MALSLKTSALCLCVFQLFLPVRCWEQGAEVFSARCTPDSSGVQSCVVDQGEDPNAQATGTFQDDIETSGWARLLIKTPSEGGLSSFAAGYLEGFLTAGRVKQHLTNALAGAKLDPPSPGVRNFVETADVWAQRMAHQVTEDDNYWGAVRAVRWQFDGLVAGVRAGLAVQGSKRISRLDLLLLNSLSDMDDIKQAVNTSERADFERMGMEAISLWTRQHGHCSSIVKLLPNASDIFAGHNTWFGFHLMLRVFKRYEFGSRTPIAMPSYPGVLSSADDSYQVGKLVIMETTLPNYNNELFALIRPQALPFWVRAMVANRLAKSGAQWMEVFKQYNSGTYNNMWMVVDYARFTPGKPLPAGVLTVGEQLPGYFHYDDQTRVLSYGYWPSYNVAVYPETARLIKQDIMVARQGNKFSYEMAERAQIFRRDQASIESDEDMQRVMRYNRFQTDPIAHGDPCGQLACRADLDSNFTSRRAFGAIDAKYTSLAHVQEGRTVAVSGPTHDDQPAFDWRLVPDLSAVTSHVGHPPRYDFGWVVIGGRDLSATPWSSFPNAAAGPENPAAGPENPFKALSLAAVVVAVGGIVTALKLLRPCLQQRDTTSGGADYKRLLSDASLPSPSDTAIGA
eukprot:CAMPEP_0172665738 /NCGR_PEP_ID=MMETSP1074-20121228/7422_1 /TAXON_ID=2916 /ORGANISM="Ceratium fusus, Strain PA161109" /LENGTH=623 /DNA_ID=CAMNT_0013482079 /DNA_START=84 /DNA_END=1955 /DNA_ORIENTATION=+